MSTQAAAIFNVGAESDIIVAIKGPVVPQKWPLADKPLVLSKNLIKGIL